MISFRGNFVEGVKEEFAKVLKNYPQTKIISMDSPGGLLSVGYNVGMLLSDYKLDVWVPQDKACISACALAFLGGWEYRVSGTLAFHAPWLPNYIGDMKLMDIYSQGQNTGAVQSYYFAANGFRAQFYKMLAQYTNRDTFMIFTNTDDLNHFLMYPERTYEEYLEVKDPPTSVLQGTGELIAAVVKRKRLEVLKNKGQFNYKGSGGEVPDYKDLQRELRPKNVQ